MRKIVIIFIVLGSLNSFCQDWKSKLDGTFQKNYAGTYTEVEFNSNTTFKFKKSWDINSYNLSGTYQIKGDTIVLNSERDFVDINGDHFSMTEEKWIIIDENKIYQGIDYNPSTIYVGGFLERKIE